MLPPSDTPLIERHIVNEKLAKFKDRIVKGYKEHEDTILLGIYGLVAVSSIVVIRQNRKLNKSLSRAHKGLKLLVEVQSCVDEVVKTGVPHDWFDQFGDPLFQIVSLRKTSE
jgi:hypothetical protein